MDSRTTNISLSEKPLSKVANGKRRATVTTSPGTTTTTTTTSSPCGACKFLRRKCTPGCVFAAHFSSAKGAARFAAVHKVFGASNVSKLLLHLPPACRSDAVATVCYEAQARLSDPVYGCVATVLALQQQVAALQEELSVVQAHLSNTKLAIAASLQNQHNTSPLPPPPSNIASVVNTSSYSNTIDHEQPDGSQQFFDFSTNGLSTQFRTPEGGEDEESSRNPVAFIDDIFPEK